ncbi:hypothetical protein HHJ78_00165 [Mobiluncus mulieris]|uniref:Uncharacterized protein n=1 Tax=Mobiluncus mulieris TaxID=2052 RepID=A0A7Y0Y327_9ACTO|nr:hypothetical protein [Mobiluncus mulieris]NMW63991.1 hypothetical protein [Mobiluncus mulieris]
MNLERGGYLKVCSPPELAPHEPGENPTEKRKKTRKTEENPKNRHENYTPCDLQF